MPAIRIFYAISCDPGTSTIIYQCSTCGTKEKKILRTPIGLLGPWGTTFTASWHSEEKGGCSAECRACGQQK